MKEKQSRNFNISPIKKNHILLLHQNSLLKKSQELILNNTKNYQNTDHPTILRRFEQYFNNHPVRDLKMIQEMINQNTTYTCRKNKNNPVSSLILDRTYEKKQYQLIGINTLRKKVETNTKIINIQRQDKKLILRKPSPLFKDNQMSYTVNPAIIDRNSSKNLNKITNSRTESFKKMKMTTSIDISKYLNEDTTIQQSSMQVPLYKQKPEYKIHFRNSSDAIKEAQNRQQTSKTLQCNKQKTNRFVNRRIISKNQLQQSYRDQAKFRCASPLKKQQKISILQYLNPLKKTQFIQNDLLDSIAFINNVKIKNMMNGSFFNVFIQQGNNSQLLKMIIRSVCGWRVVQLPQTANFIWTQVYKKKIVQKRPNKILKDQIIEEEQDKLRSQSKTSANHRTYIGQLRKSQKLQDIQKFQAYIASIKLEVTFQNQLKKILPQGTNVQSSISLNKKFDELVITPNFLIHNHLPDHKCISDKKNLLKNLKRYYQKIGINPFQYLPQSYHLGSLDEAVKTLQSQDQSRTKQVWLIKPGEDSNRGKGIAITKGSIQTFQQLKKRFQHKSQKQKQKQSLQKQQNSNLLFQLQKKQKSVILQRYIMPLLYCDRKFDIRSYMLVTVVNNNLNAYFYEECYMRTSSRKFDINSFNKYIHLTNDAIQCNSHDYGKYEEGNKLSQIQFRKFLTEDIKSKKQKGNQNVLHLDEENYWMFLKQQMAQRCKDIIRSVSKQLFQSTKSFKSINKNILNHNLFVKGTSPTNKKAETSQFFSTKVLQNTQQSNSRSSSPIFFQLFGLDFLIDESYKLWLIQVNTNPAITHDCSRVLNKLIPKLLQNTFALAVMPYMRPNRLSQASYNNQFLNIFSQTFSEKIQEKIIQD